MKSYFDQHIGFFPNTFSKNWCNDLITIFEKNYLNLVNRQKAEGISVFLKKDNVLNGLDTDVLSPYIDYFYNIFFQITLPLYCQEYPIEILDNNNNFESSFKLEGFKIQKTLPGEGYHMWHCENMNISPFINRVLAWTIYLNDVEEGGETEFLHQHKRVKPQQGTLCIFPAYYTHTHRGNPPLSNPKYIATGWVQYKEVKDSKEVGINLNQNTWITGKKTL